MWALTLGERATKNEPEGNMYEKDTKQNKNNLMETTYCLIFNLLYIWIAQLCKFK